MPSDLQEQIERRRERAREEILKITNKGSHPVFSQFEVKSVSGRSYRVEIRSLDELQNSCTCPDYKTNLIGTCKHIEGVLIHLREEYSQDLEKMVKQRPLEIVGRFFNNDTGLAGNRCAPLGLNKRYDVPGSIFLTMRLETCI